MLPYLLAINWTTCGLLAWCACLADFYEIGTRYPMLGAADEQWARSRHSAMPVASMTAILGPIGLLVALLATRGFRHGMRLW